jgi:signal transduction histidine kinase
MPATRPYAEGVSSGLRGRIARTFANGVTAPPAPRPRLLQRGRLDLVFVADVVLALILLGVSDGGLGAQNSAHHSPHSASLLILVSFVLSVPLVLRNRLPLTAWTASALAIYWASAVIRPRSLSSSPYLPTGVIVYVLCLYAVAVRCRTWVVIGTGVVSVLGALVIDHETVPVAFVVVAIPLVAGVIVRARRGAREQLEVAERRHVGERALLEERQRIARELHDVVAHHMSVIAIQAEAAPYKTAVPPPELVESFGEIRASALSGLNELRRVLGVLRSDQPDVAPQPGLGDLDGLIESARAGGVMVTSTVTGTPRPLPEGVDLSAYRIVQEALSNAMRHAPRSEVRVRLYYGEAVLVIEVRSNGYVAATDGQRAKAGLGSGHGIIGMRERATMLGGHLEAGPTGDDEFLVTAALPLSSDGQDDPP